MDPELDPDLERSLDPDSYFARKCRFKKDWLIQCCGSSGWTTRIIFPRAYKQCFGLNLNLKYLNSLVRLRDGKLRIRDGKKIVFGIRDLGETSRIRNTGLIMTWSLRPPAPSSACCSHAPGKPPWMQRLFIIFPILHEKCLSDNKTFFSLFQVCNWFYKTVIRGIGGYIGGMGD